MDKLRATPKILKIYIWHTRNVGVAIYLWTCKVHSVLEMSIQYGETEFDCNQNQTRRSNLLMYSLQTNKPTERSSPFKKLKGMFGT